MTPQAIAILQVFGAALTFGLSTPLSKLLMGRLDPMVLACMLYFGAWLGLSLLSLFPGESKGVRLEKRHLPFFLISVLVGGVLGQLLLMWGIAHTAASSAALLMNLEVVWTVLIAGLFFGEHLGGRVLFAMALMFGAGALISYQGSFSGLSGFSLGSLAVVASFFCWGLDNNVTNRLSEIDPVELTRIKGAISGCLNLLFALFLGKQLHWDAAIFGALLLGALTYGGSLVLFIRALRVLGTARTGAYFGMSPFIGALASILILRDPVTPHLLVAGLVMALAAYLLLGERHSHPHEHPAIEHEHFHEHDEHHRHHEEEELPHCHLHVHEPQEHAHPHTPDLHHRHVH